MKSEDIVEIINEQLKTATHNVCTASAKLGIDPDKAMHMMSEVLSMIVQISTFKNYGKD